MKLRESPARTELLLGRVAFRAGALRRLGVRRRLGVLGLLRVLCLLALRALAVGVAARAVAIRGAVLGRLLVAGPALAAPGPAVGPVEARPLEDDPGRGHHLGDRPAAARMLLQGVVVDGLPELELLTALRAPVLVRRHRRPRLPCPRRPPLALSVFDC